MEGIIFRLNQIRSQSEEMKKQLKSTIYLCDRLEEEIIAMSQEINTKDKKEG